MLTECKINYRDNHFVDMIGKWENQSNKARHIFLFKPDTDIEIQDYILTDLTRFQWKQFTSIILASLFFVSSIFLFFFQGRHFIGPLLFAISMIFVFYFRHLQGIAKYSKNWRNYAWDIDMNAVSNNVVTNVGKAYLAFIKGKSIVSADEWDLLSVNDEDFYRECVSVIELQDKIKSLDVGIDGSVDTAMEIKKAMANVNIRVENLKKIANYGADAALYATAHNILSGVDAVPIEMVQDAEVRHRTLKALTSGDTDTDTTVSDQFKAM